MYRLYLVIDLVLNISKGSPICKLYNYIFNVKSFYLCINDLKPTNAVLNDIFI